MNKITLDSIITPSEIGSGQRYVLMKSGSTPTLKSGTIGDLMNVFLHQQQSTIRHIYKDIQKHQKSRSKNKQMSASYKIGVYKQDIMRESSLEWFDQEIVRYFNSLPGFSAQIDLDRPISAGVTHPVWIKISWTDTQPLPVFPDMSGSRADQIEK